MKKRKKEKMAEAGFRAAAPFQMGETLMIELVDQYPNEEGEDHDGRLLFISQPFCANFEVGIRRCFRVVHR